MPSLKFSNTNYRYGFNGKENDPETGTQDYGLRIYDTRIAKFLSSDPLTHSFPWYTPYQFAGNKPIQNIDLDGAEELPTTGEGNSGDWGGDEFKGNDKLREANVTLNGTSGPDGDKNFKTFKGASGTVKNNNANQGDVYSGCGDGDNYYHCGTSGNDYKDEGWYKERAYKGLFLQTIQGQFWFPSGSAESYPIEIGIKKSGLQRILELESPSYSPDTKVTHYIKVNPNGFFIDKVPAPNFVYAGIGGGKWTIYTAVKEGNLYIGSAKYFGAIAKLSYRYSSTAIKNMNASIIRDLCNIPTKATARGVEQQIMLLNGWKGAASNKIATTLSNKANATNKYADDGLKWLNENIPNWQELFKFK